MRRDRKAKQQAEADRDAARFELSKTKKEKPAEKPAEEEDPFKGREDDDLFTVADAKKILAKSQKKEEVKMDASFMELPAVQTFLKGCDIVAANEHKEDYEVVMDLTDQIIMANPAHQKLIAEAFSRGENPALKQYELIKGDPSFSKLLPMAQTRVAARKTKKAEEKPKEEPKAKSAEELQKEADAKKAEEALEANQTKPKTSGHAEGKDKIEGSDLTIEQIASMSDREFAKLPKKTREKYLEMYG
jgi:glucan-binding YG repeat protein